MVTWNLWPGAGGIFYMGKLSKEITGLAGLYHNKLSAAVIAEIGRPYISDYDMTQASLKSQAKKY